MALQIENSNGNIIIQDEVIAKIAGMAATSCYGVVGMTAKKGSGGLASLLFGDSITKGVNVSIEDEKVVIDLHIVVEYGVNIATISESIINSVKYNVESMTGFKIGKITVHVDGTRVDL